MRAHIFVRTIGSVVIEVGDRRIGPSAGRLFALLLYLTSRRGQPTSRRVVQELLFPDSGEGQASHNLRQLIYRLRQAGVPVESDADQVAIPADGVTIDWLCLLTAHPIDDIELDRLSHGVFPGYSPAVSETYRTCC